MDEPIEGGGSFDATGAFLGVDERNIGDKSKLSDTSQTNVQTVSEPNEKRINTMNVSNASDSENPSNDVSEHVRTTDKDEISKSNVTNEPPNDSPVIKDESSTDKREKDLITSETEVQIANDEKTMSNKPVSGNVSFKNTSKCSEPDGREKANIITQSEKMINKVTVDATPTIDRLQEDIEKLIMDDDQSCNENDEALLAPHLHARDAQKHSKTDDVLTEKTKESDHWYYRDPQGKVQGPFTTTEMHEWYRAGYFDETLNVRRVCDRQFVELGELLKAYSGSTPFVSTPPIISPLLQSTTNEITMSTAPNVKPSSTPTKPIANHLVHTGKIPPPSSANQPPYYDIMQTQNYLSLINPPANDFRKYFT